MSTNYYLEKTCPCCDNVQQIHLGKSSAGWTFSFRGDREAGIVDFEAWLNRIDKKLEDNWRIRNEYGEATTLTELLQLIETKRSEPNSHATYLQTDPKYSAYYNAEKDWLDDKGNSFTDCEFS
jgi:hypothetical protein